MIPGLDVLPLLEKVEVEEKEEEEEKNEGGKERRTPFKDSLDTRYCFYMTQFFIYNSCKIHLFKLAYTIQS